MRYVQGLLLVTVFAWLVCVTDQFGLAAGPYEVALEQLYKCEDQGTNLAKLDVTLYLGPPDSTKQRKRKRLHKGSFSWPFTKEQMASMEIATEHYLKKSNGYILMYKHHDNFCHTMMTFVPKSYANLKEALGLPGEGCGVPAGNYTFNDWDMLFIMPASMLEYGSYKVLIRFLSEQKVFMCITMLADVIPKDLN